MDKPIPKEEIRRLLEAGAKSADELDEDLKKVFRLPEDDLVLDAPTTGTEE